MRTFLIVLALTACKDKPSAQPTEPLPTLPKGDSVAVAAPTGASHADWIKPVKQVPWTPPSRPPSDQEQLLNGTWAGTVGDFASTSTFMADRVMFSLDGSNKDLVSNVLQAMEKDQKLASHCIWLELRPDLGGIRRECAIVNGQPSALDQNDVVTGKKSDLGVKLHWFVDGDDVNKIKIKFDEDMVVPALRDGKLVKLVFRQWILQFDKQLGNNHFTIKETFPEHGYELPTHYEWEIAPGGFLDK